MISGVFFYPRAMPKISTKGIKMPESPIRKLVLLLKELNEKGKLFFTSTLVSLISNHQK
jgi:hypothetical protein